VFRIRIGYKFRQKNNGRMVYKERKTRGNIMFSRALFGARGFS
jgi:hypothetical protein